MTVHDDVDNVTRRPEFETLVGALRQPARPDERAGELEIVEAMAAMVASSETGPRLVAIRSHTPKLAAVAAAAALLVGGITAAAASVFHGSEKVTVIPSDGPLTPQATIATSTTTTTTSVRSTTTSSSVAPNTTTSVTGATSTSVATEQSTEPTTASSEDQGTAAARSAVTAPPCPADVTNHGEYVSGVAHATPPGPEHGQIVSAAAQSDCGKPGATASSDATSSAATTGLASSTVTASPSNSDNSGKGNGNSDHAAHPTGPTNKKH
jgi:hypothetical protein